MTTFTPLSGLIGGLMIGLAALMYLLLSGRIAGISGIFAGLITEFEKESQIKLGFIAGLIVGPLLVSVFWADAGTIQITSSLPVLLAGGFLVGFGTRLGSGCTSGHGVCGVARGSLRSISATVTFFLFANLTVYVTRHMMGG